MLLDLIELQFQNKPSSAFQAHPITTKVAAATLLVFVSPFGLEVTFHSYSADPLRTAPSYWLFWHHYCSWIHDHSPFYAYVTYTSAFTRQFAYDSPNRLFTKMQQWNMRRYFNIFLSAIDQNSTNVINNPNHYDSLKFTIIDNKDNQRKK